MPATQKYGNRNKRVVVAAKRPRRYRKRKQVLAAFQPGRSRTLLPSAFKLNMRYSINSGDTHAITSTVGSVADFTYRANGLYDPYFGVGGAQPRGFDQFMALYRYCTCIGSKAVITFFYQDDGGPAVGSNESMKVAIVLNDNATAIANQVDMAEAPNVAVGTLTGNNSPMTMSKSFSVRKDMKISHPLSDGDLVSTTGANPTNMFNYHIGGYAYNSQTTTAYFTGYIDYICIFTKPITPGQS